MSVFAGTAFAGLTGRPRSPWTPEGLASGLLATALAFGVAALGVRGHIPKAALLHRLHSGHVGDYVAWLVAGVTVFGLLLMA